MKIVQGDFFTYLVIVSSLTAISSDGKHVVDGEACLLISDQFTLDKEAVAIEN